MKKTLLSGGLLLAVSICHAQATFEALNDTVALGAYNSSGTFLDADSDGDQDFVYCGASSAGMFTKLILNDGLGNFTESSEVFQQVYAGRAISADINNDGDKDLFISGSNVNGQTVTSASMLYDNDGIGHFTENLTSTIFAFYAGDAEFFDSDGDADFDLLVSGFNAQDTLVRTVLYVNNGSGIFTESAVVFEPLFYSNFTIGDVDSDGDKDAFFCGATLAGTVFSKLYINNGNNDFTPSSQNFVNMICATEFIDLDNDNDLDLVCSGNDLAVVMMKVYINDGQGNFAESPNYNFIPLDNAAIKVFDADSDGDSDLFMAGSASASIEFKHYDNQNGTFVDMAGQPFAGFFAGTIEPGDIDNDDDLDFYASGFGVAGDAIADFYRNTTAVGLYELTTTEFSVAPNPIQDKQLNFNAKTLDLGSEFDLEILDIQGRKVHNADQMKNTLTDFSIDLSGIPAGSYFLRLKSGERIAVSKFIIPNN